MKYKYFKKNILMQSVPFDIVSEIWIISTLHVKLYINTINMWCLITEKQTIYNGIIMQLNINVKCLAK